MNSAEYHRSSLKKAFKAKHDHRRAWFNPQATQFKFAMVRATRTRAARSEAAAGASPPSAPVDDSGSDSE
jgi:hypothetical protein